jgi:hypothetical protein
LQDLSTTNASDGSCNGIAQRTEIEVLESGAGGIAAYGSGHELDDEIEDRRRHDTAPSFETELS